MNFKDNKSIYIQIADRICDDILLGKFIEDERIPSVREYAALVEVNANTVMRTYDYLQSQDIIYNKRGIGYFVSVDSKKIIHTLRKQTFLSEELEYFFRQIYTLDISMSKINALYESFKEKQQKIINQ